MVIRAGSVYWVQFSPSKGSEPKGKRPGLVIQADALNNSRLNTTIVLAITSNLKFGQLPGNVVLGKGEANLKKSSVINVTQFKTVDKRSLKEKIGTLTKERFQEVQDGLQLIMNLSAKPDR